MVRTFRNVVIIGPQASGKGTQAKYLAHKLNIPHISIGNVLRAEVESGSERGKIMQEYMHKGELIPNDINEAVVSEELKKHTNGILLDGYPRNIAQAHFLDTHLDIDLVLVLRVPDAVCIERISGRRVCDKGHDYHVVYDPPKQEGICDEDGLPLHMRDDDQPDAIAKRLSIYHAQTEPIIAHYQKKGVVVEIDGTKSIEAVTTDIFLTLDL